MMIFSILFSSTCQDKLYNYSLVYSPLRNRNQKTIPDTGDRFFKVYLYHYFRLPKSWRSFKKRLMKSRYRVKAPITASLVSSSVHSLPIIFMLLIFCVSYAVSAMNTITPMIAIIVFAIELPIHMFMSPAMITPMSPKNARVPIPVRSFFV